MICRIIHIELYNMPCQMRYGSLTLYGTNHFPILQKTNRLVIFCYFGVIKRKIQKKSFVLQQLKILKNGY